VGLTVECNMPGLAVPQDPEYFKFSGVPVTCSKGSVRQPHRSLLYQVIKQASHCFPHLVYISKLGHFSPAFADIVD